MSGLAVWFGVAAMLCSVISTINMMLAAYTGQKESARHSEYQAIGWAAVAALMWIVAK